MFEHMSKVVYEASQGSAKAQETLSQLGASAQARADGSRPADGKTRGWTFEGAKLWFPGRRWRRRRLANPWATRYRSWHKGRPALKK